LVRKKDATAAAEGATPAAAGAPGAVELAVLLAAIILIATLVRSAWVCDDAFITLRTVDNFVNGHGLTWNVAERVQTYTHPLWMMLLTAVYFFTREAYFSGLALSLVLSSVVIWLTVTRVARSSLGALLGLAVLILSKSFVDFSTSGLENPLTHLLLALFVAACFPARGPRRPVVLALIAGLGVLNRMDTLLLYLPALAWALRETPRKQALKTLALGFSPFLAWELFALFYYGFLFPNPAYAKLATGIPRLERLEQGFHYFLNSLSVDPLTLVAVAGATLLALRDRHAGEIALGAGIGLYLAYTLWIGGDFMGGRFFSAPLFVSALILSRWDAGSPGVASLLPFLLVGVLGLSTPFSPVFSDFHYARHRAEAADNARITDERAFYYEGSGLLRAGREFEMPTHKSAIEGRQARQQGPAVVVRGGVGMFGYYAGPAVHIIEPWAVCAPLLARLPVAEGAFWRIGHFPRELPAGYEETQRTGSRRITDPQVARLYDALEIVTRDPLFSGRRLVEIWKLNTGAYALR